MSRIVDTIRHEAPAPPGPAAGYPRPRRKGNPAVGVVQYFHIHDHETVERVIDGLARLPVKNLRTAVSWCDWLSEGGEEWYRWLLPKLIERFEVLPCFLYTPPELGLVAKTSSPPRDPAAYGQFLELILRRYEGAFEHVELWNEPNNYIEWDWTIDPEWKIFAEMIGAAARRAAGLGVKPVLGGMSPFDPNWLDLMFRRGALEHVEVIGVHGFPGTWEAVWEGWDAHIERVREVLERHSSPARVWITECGFSTWAHDEFRQLTTMTELADAPADRVYWYAVEDLAPERETLDGFHCDERAYHFGLQRRSGRPKLLARVLAERGLGGVREIVEFGARSNGYDSRPRALITGGAGFIGTNLAHRLASEGEPVTVLDSLVREGAEANLRWLKQEHGDLVRVELGDVRDVFALRTCLERCERVFHLAAQAGDGGAPTDYLDVNLRGTVNLLEEARRLERPPPILFASTSEVYEGIDDRALRAAGGRYEPREEPLRAHGVSERHPLGFSSPYACSKGAADQYVLDYARSFGMQTCVLRISCAYGPRQSGHEEQGWVGQSLIDALRGQPITVPGDGMQVRDMLYVDDLVEAMLRVFSSDRALQGAAFNIGGGSENAASVAEVIDLIEELEGARPELRHRPWRASERRYYVSDLAKFSALSGWEPKVSLDRGLSRLHRWLVERSPERRSAAGESAALPL